MWGPGTRVLPQAMQMEHMAARKLFVASSHSHFLAADDADAITARQILGCGLSKALIHVGSDTAVPQEVCHSIAEVSEGPVQVSDLTQQAG